MIELARRTRALPAPPHVVFESLTDPLRPQGRPWLVLLADETEPRLLDVAHPHTVVWSSLWPGRPEDGIHLHLAPRGPGGTSHESALEFVLLTPDGEPDPPTLGHLRKRLNHLFFADLRFSFGK